MFGYHCECPPIRTGQARGGTLSLSRVAAKSPRFCLSLAGFGFFHRSWDEGAAPTRCALNFDWALLSRTGKSTDPCRMAPCVVRIVLAPAIRIGQARAAAVVLRNWRKRHPRSLWACRVSPGPRTDWSQDGAM